MQFLSVLRPGVDKDAGFKCFEDVLIGGYDGECVIDRLDINKSVLNRQTRGSAGLRN